jgi:hypoxanthine phosphoribosyltransferase
MNVSWTTKGMIADDRLQLLIPEEEIRARVEFLAHRINQDLAGSNSLVVIGVLQGAYMFLADLVRRLKTDVRQDFLWLSSYGDGCVPSGPVRLVKDIEADVAGRDVLVVEDVVDSGGSLAFLLEHLSAKRPASLRVCALLDKRQDARGGLDYVGFQIEAQFVVGYGLDLDGRYRQLPDIYRLVDGGTDGR